MKVAFFPDYTKRNPYQTNLINALKSQGVEVTLGDTPSLSPSGIMPILSTLYRHPDTSVVHFHWLHPYIYSDYLVLTLVNSLFSILELLILKFINVKLVYTVHNTTSHNSAHPWLECRIKRFFMNLVCDEIIIHCPGAADIVGNSLQLNESTRQQMNVVPHGHYISSYDNDITKKEARTKLNLDSEETVFLFFGAIRPYKRVPELIEAFRECCGPDDRLVIAGDPMSKDLKRTVLAQGRDDDRIRLELHFIPEDEVQQYFNASDIAVIPYRDVLTPGSAILTMSFRTGIIAPRYGCLPELIPDEGGILYHPDDSTPLRDSLRKVKQYDFDLMGENNYQHICDYTWEMAAEKTVEVYEATNRS